MNAKSFSLALFTAIWIGLSGAALAAGLESQGTVVVAKTQGKAMILWDLTPAVAPIVAQPGTADSKLVQIEVAAAKVLLGHLNEMSAATSVTVRAIYQKTGDVSPLYRTATFLGVEKVLEVTAPRASAASNKTAWQAQLDKGQLPTGITVTVTGALPPPQ